MFQTPGYLWLLLLLPLFLWVGWPSRGQRQFSEFVALFLRSLLIICLILGLAELTLQIPNNRLSVIYLLDVSDSIPRSQQRAALDFIQQSIDSKPPDDLAGLIVFGGNALVERPLSNDLEVNDIDSVPVSSQTDIGEAINLAQALFPADTAKRIVLLTDGSNNQGELTDAIQVANTNGIDIIQFPLETNSSDDAAVLDLQMPTRLPQDKSFDLAFTVYSSVSQSAVVQILSSGNVVSEQDIQLQEGEQSFSIPLVTDQIGVNEFEVQLISANDAVPQNNHLSGVTYVTGPPRVLVVSVPAGSVYPDGEARPDEAGALIRTLENGNYEFDVTQPENLPLDPGHLAKYNAVILIDVPGQSLSLVQMRTLQSYVQNLGGGLVTIGGLTSYGVGGYYDTPLEEMLPINMQNQDEVRKSTLTLVFVIDRSNSMTDTSGGISKLELAKEAVLRSIELLKPNDKVGVVIFDSSPRWVTPITEVSEKDAILASVASIRSGGGTNILAGLQAVAQQLPADDGQVKHVILLTDGGANPSGIPELVQRMKQTYKITLTSVGVGNDAAPFLSDLALLGGGRFHYVTDPQTIPSIFTEETTLATRSYVVEEPFSPQIKANSPILSRISGLPILHGYVTSSTKEAGSIILTSERGDPVLASWQYGLGKTVAFTSDASGRWARNWLSWSGFSSFWNQAISYVSSPIVSSNIELDILSGNGSNMISVIVRDEAGKTMNSFEMAANIVSQDGQAREVLFEQTGPGKYQANIDALEPGSYTISLSGTNLESEESILETFGWSQSYSPEYIPLMNRTELKGQISSLVSMVDSPKSIFVHKLEMSNSIQPIWQRLIIFTAMLLVLDITVRRIKISNQDVEKSWAWIKSVAHFGKTAPQTGSATAIQYSTLLDLKQRRQKADQSTPLNVDQSVIVRSEPVLSEKNTQNATKREVPSQQTTVATLLSNKREREKRRSI
jgi:Ca-activated chloride channel family protein